VLNPAIPAGTLPASPLLRFEFPPRFSSFFLPHHEREDATEITFEPITAPRFPSSFNTGKPYHLDPGEYSLDYALYYDVLDTGTYTMYTDDANGSAVSAADTTTAYNYYLANDYPYYCNYLSYQVTVNRGMPFGGTGRTSSSIFISHGIPQTT
jgi:hypothetical protein